VQTASAHGPGDASEARAAVADGARRLASDGFVAGTSGNVSARFGGLIAITPTGASLATVEADDITVVDIEGAVVDGALAPSSELGLHLGIYTRYGAGAVVHTHAPVATALSCVLDEVPCVHYDMLDLGGTVRVAPFRTFGTPELAEVALEALEGRTAALLSNHGAVVVGDSVAQALARSRLLEWACTVYWRAASIGTPRTLDETQRRAVAEAMAYWRSLRPQS
jgi:L-fuculose-phosphate aldolase